MRDDDAFQSSSVDQEPTPDPAAKLNPRTVYTHEEKFTLYEKQQQKQYDLLKRRTQEEETRNKAIDDLSRHFEEVSREVEDRHRRQDLKEEVKKKHREDVREKAEERQRQWKEQDRIHEDKIKVLVAERMQMEKENDLMNAARDRVERPVTREEAQILTLESEIRELEERRTRRWRELIVANQWDNHDQDPEVIAIANSLDIKRKVKAQMQMWFTEERMKEENKPSTSRSPAIAPEWGHAKGPLDPDPNFAPTPWSRFSWGNTNDQQGPEPEPISWGRSRTRRSHSPSSSSSTSSSRSSSTSSTKSSRSSNPSPATRQRSPSPDQDNNESTPPSYHIYKRARAWMKVVYQER